MKGSKGAWKGGKTGRNDGKGARQISHELHAPSRHAPFPARPLPLSFFIFVVAVVCVDVSCGLFVCVFCPRAHGSCGCCVKLQGLRLHDWALAQIAGVCFVCLLSVMGYHTPAMGHAYNTK